MDFFRYNYLHPSLRGGKHDVPEPIPPKICSKYLVWEPIEWLETLNWLVWGYGMVGRRREAEHKNSSFLALSVTIYT